MNDPNPNPNPTPSPDLSPNLSPNPNPNTNPNPTPNPNPNPNQVHNWTFYHPIPSMMHEMGCAWHPYFNDWPDGLEFNRHNTPPYADSRPVIDMRLSFLEKTVTYLSGSKDVCPCIASVDRANCTGDEGPDCHLEGSCHMEVVHAFAQRMQLMHQQMAADGTCTSCKHRPPTHNLVSVPDVGHDGCGMFEADETLDAMFPRHKSAHRVQ